jgi:hypothetical protein
MLSDPQQQVLGQKHIACPPAITAGASIGADQRRNESVTDRRILVGKVQRHDQRELLR